MRLLFKPFVDELAMAVLVIIFYPTHKRLVSDQKRSLYAASSSLLIIAVMSVPFRISRPTYQDAGLLNLGGRFLSSRVSRSCNVLKLDWLNASPGHS